MALLATRASRALLGPLEGTQQSQIERGPPAVEMRAQPAARSRVGRQSVHDDGTTRCRLAIPLGHPAARRRDDNGHVFEVEHAIEYAAGPGSQALRWINPTTRAEEHDDNAGGSTTRAPRARRRHCRRS